MPNGEHKPGEALADRLRERNERNRKRRSEHAKALFDDWDEPTYPQLRVIRAPTVECRTNPSSAPPSLTKVPIIGRVLLYFPRAWRPYLMLAAVVGAVAYPPTRNWALGFVGLGVDTHEHPTQSN